jgi:hypothetical protein
MQRHALVVNVARGEVIQTDDLVVALQEGQIGGAALDVTDPEPLPANHPLWTLSTKHEAMDVEAEKGGKMANLIIVRDACFRMVRRVLTHSLLAHPSTDSTHSRHYPSDCAPLCRADTSKRGIPLGRQRTLGRGSGPTSRVLASSSFVRASSLVPLRLLIATLLHA